MQTLCVDRSQESESWVLKISAKKLGRCTGMASDAEFQTEKVLILDASVDNARRLSSPEIPEIAKLS